MSRRKSASTSKRSPNSPRHLTPAREIKRVAVPAGGTPAHRHTLSLDGTWSRPTLVEPSQFLNKHLVSRGAGG